MVTSIINTALAYNPGQRRMCTFSRYLEETIPEQFRIAKDQAMRIYLCQSYAHIGVARKSDWTAKLNELCRAHKVSQDRFLRRSGRCISEVGINFPLFF